MNRITVTLTIGDRTMTLEGPEDFVRQEVERFAGAAGVVPSSNIDRQGTVDGPRISERELLDQKAPSGHVEIVTVLAFALKQSGTMEFSETDIHRAYLRARERPPKVLAQSIRDAKNKFDYIESGELKGTYKLSPHGERTVIFDLPRKTKASSSIPSEG
jgi:hypothetical protein